MSLPLSETHTIQEIAKLLYSFLPGQPHPFADQKISFAGIAYDLGLKNFWTGGSKLPSIITLLENTLERKRDTFCRLIVEVVKRGIKYRVGKEKPITREEIKELNQLLLKLNFKIPELWKKDFLDSLPSLKQSEISREVQKEEKIDKQKQKELIEKLIEIEKLPSKQRGFAFEKFLYELFEVFELKPRSSFRLEGEQIDGSLELDGETYLIEAKWESKQTGLQDLLVFHDKIAAKATWTRGIFISYSGFTEEALRAFSKWRPANFITLTAQDLYFILSGHGGVYIDLDEAIRIKARYTAETGNIGVSVYELLITKGGK